MLEALKLRLKQGRQYIPDVTTRSPRRPFRGLPLIDESRCDGCRACVAVCPAGAVGIDPVHIDMGRCVFCGECARACSREAITFSNFHQLGATSRETLTVGSGITPEKYLEYAIACRKEIVGIFGRSLKLRSVSAGGCNACELELNACSNVNFDMGRFGIETVASPRHADGVVVTGPVSANMATALEATFEAVPAPKLVILMGSCAISGGVFAASPELDRRFLDRYPVDLYLPGCPVHPLTFINGVLGLIGRKFK
ncbi:MAG: 4Fe-4S binding protein [Victivallales bacterium]|nr:4Fe-4S binding protein [Victivallales bacterium]